MLVRQSTSVPNTSNSSAFTGAVMRGTMPHADGLANLRESTRARLFPTQHRLRTLGDGLRHGGGVLDETLHGVARCRVEFRLALLDLGAKIRIVQHDAEGIAQHLYAFGWKIGRRHD